MVVIFLIYFKLITYYSVPGLLFSLKPLSKWCNIFTWLSLPQLHLWHSTHPLLPLIKCSLSNFSTFSFGSSITNPWSLYLKAYENISENVFSLQSSRLQYTVDIKLLYSVSLKTWVVATPHAIISLQLPQNSVAWIVYNFPSFTCFFTSSMCISML